MSISSEVRKFRGTISLSTTGIDGGKRTWMKDLRKLLISHIRRITIEIVNLFLNHDLVFKVIGLANKRLKVINSVFLVYPANENYGLFYAYCRRLQRNVWDPWLVGIFWQNGKVGIKFAISAHNGQFRDSTNEERLRKLANRIEELRRLFHAERKAFAGILPGILFLKRIVRETPEAEVTVKIIVQAIKQTKLAAGLPEDSPVIVLGGKGFIGRRVVSSISERVYDVDIDEKESVDWPFHLWGQQALLVNITLNSVLDYYIDSLWPEVVVLNEVYPEPSRETIEGLKKIGCLLYHITGVKGRAFPAFPFAYQGGIPCCAAWPASEIEVLLLKMT